MILLHGIRVDIAKGSKPSKSPAWLDANSIRKQFFQAFQKRGREYLSYQNKQLNFTSIILIDGRFEIVFPNGLPNQRTSLETATPVPSLPVDWWKSGERVVHEPHPRCKDMFKSYHQADNLVMAFFHANQILPTLDQRPYNNSFLNTVITGTGGFSIGEIGRVRSTSGLWKSWLKSCDKGTKSSNFLLHPTPKECLEIDTLLSKPDFFYKGLSTGITINCARAWRMLRNHYIARSYQVEAIKPGTKAFQMPHPTHGVRHEIIKLIIIALHSMADEAGSPNPQNQVFGNVGSAIQKENNGQEAARTQSSPPQKKDARNTPVKTSVKEPNKSLPKKKKEKERNNSTAHYTSLAMRWSSITKRKKVYSNPTPSNTSTMTSGEERKKNIAKRKRDNEGRNLIANRTPTPTKRKKVQSALETTTTKTKTK
jgi:hypothetical protein